MRESGARREKDRNENVWAWKQMVLALFGAFCHEIMDYGKIFCPHVQATHKSYPSKHPDHPKKIKNIIYI